MSRRYKEMQYIMSQSYHRYRRPNATIDDSTNRS
jgi:hypothetical protein